MNRAIGVVVAQDPLDGPWALDRGGGPLAAFSFASSVLGAEAIGPGGCPEPPVSGLPRLRP